MKIISWNVNGIRAVEKKGFIGWILKSGADVVCIQETKAHPGQLSPQLLTPGKSQDSQNTDLFTEPATKSQTGYTSYFFSAKKPGYSGTAIYTKTKPDSVENMGDERFDNEGRVTIAKFGQLAVISAYFPNSQDAGARLDYKLEFCDAMLKKCNQLVKDGFNIVLCGDYNIAHKPIDLANPKTNEHNAGYLPEERAWMDTFTEAGYVDTFRHFCKEPEQYTWWSYRFHAREKNIGWRIDYHCVNPELLSKVKASRILADVTGSDHCPIELELE